MTSVPLYITGASSVSALGADKFEIRRSLKSEISTASTIELHGELVPVFSLPPKVRAEVNETFIDRKYRHLDKVTKLALFTGKKAMPSASIPGNARIGVCFGSARGTTETLENLHQSYLANPSHTVPPYTSPATTAGSIASAVAAELSLDGPAISSSMTCASFMHSLLTAWGLLHTGTFDGFLVGGAEAPLTPFTIAQMKALRIYSSLVENPYPCRPCEDEEIKRNTMTLGEGAAAFYIETESSLQKRGMTTNGSAKIVGIGFSKEVQISSTGMDPEGAGFKASMQMALESAKLSTVDSIVLHAPGTSLGDEAELAAINSLFGDTLPYLSSTKYLTGHTFGASAALSLMMGLEILKGEIQPTFPYKTSFLQAKNQARTKTCLINSAGFGGSIMSLIVST